MKSVHIDIETFSSVDLPTSGVYRYAEAPDFQVLLFGYSVDGGPVQVIDLANGEDIPSDVLAALTDPAILKYAHNAAFERVCLSRMLRDMGVSLDPANPDARYLAPSSWRCTMIMARYNGLPGSLAGAAEALRLSALKMAEGGKLVRRFCAPPRVLPGDAPEKWELFKSYNRRDVEVELAIERRLAKHAPPDGLWEQYAMDQAVNDRGIRVDMRLVDQAIAMDEHRRAELIAEMRECTGLENPNSVIQLKGWLADHGVAASSLDKKSVAAILADCSPEVARVLRIRQQLAKSSVSKYAAIRDTVCADGRVHGMFQFYGASRTGRWSGRLVQLHNLPQNHLDDLDDARRFALLGDGEALEILYGSVSEPLSQLIRTCFVPSQGCKLIVADYSAIEARVLAWLAGEDWRRDAFASGEDIYCASMMFGVPVVKHGVNGHLRQKGKIAELALGYGGAVGALTQMGALDMGLGEGDLPDLVSAWRDANPHIVEFWREVETAAVEAVRWRHAVTVQGVGFDFREGDLLITLPSGRSLHYSQASMSRNRFGGDCVTYMAHSQGKWERDETYGGKLTENIVQAVARDLLAHAMLTLEAHGYRIVAHVHDEVIIEAPMERTVDAVCAMMARTPSWARGLLLNADGFETQYYRKD